MDDVDFLGQFLDLLHHERVRFCVIGGQGVNAYAEPVVSLELDLVISVEDVDRLRRTLAQRFAVEEFAHSLNVSALNSDLRIQIQLDPRYAAFITRAADHVVLGERLPVAAIEDVLQGKVWAALDASRRASKRQKDLADISRLIESQPELRARVPQALLDRLL